MQKTIFITSLLASAAFAGSSHNEEMSSLWNAWKAKHNKGYTSGGEEDARFAIFSDNYQKILKFNAENETPKLALNHFADLTAEEFKNKHSGCAFFEDNEELVMENTLEFNENNLQDLPDSIDWREKGAVTPVKDQAQCGSCWAFSSTGTIEGFHAIKNGKLVSFSEQQIVDCDTADYGCNGGWPYLGVTYAAENGLETETDYPYKGYDQTCAYQKGSAIQTNTGYSFVTTKNVDALKTAITTMPVSVAIEADQSVFQFYSSGVIKSGCGAYLNHAVLAVGYTTVSGTEAFIVKNSWGTSWGDKGYVYISTDGSANSGAGVCGILSQPVVPK